MKFLILNGPNLNLLGKREPNIYGSQTFEAYFKELLPQFKEHQVEYFQSNHEGALIDKLQEVGFSIDGVVFNPGGYTHTSVALADCISAITTPVVEIHISDIYQREPFRHHSYIKAVAQYSVIGQGLDGYRQGLEFLIQLHT